MKIGILSGLLSFVVVSIISITIGLLLSLTGLEQNERLILTLTVFTISLILILVYRKQIKRYHIVWGVNWILSALNDQFGIKKIYKNFTDAKDDMKKDFLASKDIHLFFQLGRADLGGQGSLFFDETMERTEQDFCMHILFADKESKFLTKMRAEDRGSNYKEWHAVQRYVEGIIDALRERKINIEVRRHSEPYLWRLFFFGDVLYFMPYLYKRHNHEKAPVIRIVLNGKTEGAIFRTFMRYYEDIWDKNFVKEHFNETIDE